MNALLSQLIAAEKTNSLASFLPILVLGGGFAYLMFIGPKKEKKRKADLLASLRVGDEVVTTGGIYGTITFLEDGVAHIQVDTDAVIRVSKAAVARRENDSTAADDVADLTDDDVVDVAEATDTEEADTEPTEVSKPAKSARSDKSSPK